MLYAIFAVLVIILDQGVKYWVSGHVALNSQTVPFIPDILSIVNVRNDGAAFSFLAGSNARIYFIILTGVFTLVVIVLLATKFVSGSLARWSLVLVTAGGLSNCIDRVIYGYVQDMFKCEFVNFPIFNVADVFISVFAILFVLAILFGRDHRKEDFDFDEDYDDEDYDDEEEEEPRKPARRAVTPSRPRSRRPSRYDDEEDEEEEEEDEYEDEEPRPARRKSLFAARKSRRYEDEDEYEDEYEDEEEEEEEDVRPARRGSAPARQKPQPKYSAEFESIKARKQASAAPVSEETEEVEEPAPRRRAAVRQEEPKGKEESFQLPAERVDLSRLEEKPAAPARVETPAPAQPSYDTDMDFDLDSILEEFK